jgi:hypothetical protein
MQFDFFLAYASADQRAAQELNWALEDLDRDVFLDAVDIQAGARWDENLEAALAQSRLIVVLVSKHTANAHYQRDEIARAIKQMRADPNRKVVVPVLLPGATAADVPYGLSVLQSIDGGKSGGMKRVAIALNDRLPG